SKEKEEMRRNLAEMINRILPGRIGVKGGNKGAGDKKPASPEIEPGPALEEEIETEYVSQKDFPTFIKIMNKADPLVFRPNQSTRIEIMSDAPDRFLSKNGAYFTLSNETQKFVRIMYFQKDFRNGRLFVATRLVDKAPLYSKFTFE